ncbi:MAG: extensin family protein [Hyphomicrobium sp.]
MALAAGLVTAVVAASAGPAETSVNKVVNDIIVKPGKAVAKAANDVIDDLKPSTVEASKPRKKSTKSVKSGGDAAQTAAEPKPDVKPPAAAASDAAKPPSASKATTEKAGGGMPSAGKAVEDPAAAKPGTSPSFPKTLDGAKAEAEAAKKPPPAWTPEEIAAAKARCDVILKRITAVAIAQPPLREGACGAPAPIQLVSIGKSPEVSISPPATMTCELAEALDTWIKNDIQPLAKKHLGAEVIKIENMSDYSCRNAYGRAGGKLSEHGLANALDIRGFVTAAAKTAYVLEDWGVTQREINERIAAAKAAAEKAEAERLAAEKAAQENLKTTKGGPAQPPPAGGAQTAGAPAGGIARGAIVDGVPKLAVTVPGAKPKAGEAPSLSVAEPNHLGGPNAKKDAVKGEVKSGAVKADPAKPAAKAIPIVNITIGLPSKPPPPTIKGEFLHRVHAGACRIFGTTLGPEANNAHRNHFHVDMAQRKSASTKICD